MNKQLFYGELQPYFADALAIRKTVFSDEQGYAEEIDYDSTDKRAQHIVIYDEGIAVATARLFDQKSEQTYLIGRVAVLKAYRSAKVGMMMMKLLIEAARQEGLFDKIEVHAQEAVQPFYQRLGFVAYGPLFLDEGQPHISMALPLKTRGFEIAKGFETSDAVLPIRKTHASAGYDLTTVSRVVMAPGATYLVPTGLKAYMLEDEVLEIFIRSSVAIKQNVWCVNNVGVVDSDYYGNPDNDGHLMVPLYNGSNKEVVFEKGDRVAQAIFKKYLTVDGEDTSLFATRSGGFGSTGK